MTGISILFGHHAYSWKVKQCKIGNEEENLENRNDSNGNEKF